MVIRLQAKKMRWVLYLTLLWSYCSVCKCSALCILEEQQQQKECSKLGHYSEVSATCICPTQNVCAPLIWLHFPSPNSSSFSSSLLCFVLYTLICPSTPKHGFCNRLLSLSITFIFFKVIQTSVSFLLQTTVLKSYNACVLYNTIKKDWERHSCVPQKLVEFPWWFRDLNFG